MRIQRLEIQGFKSFADRTQIRFGRGITGVVGPNGCGKSNIVDAIRWVMGEQSPRLLRGGSMQDVIFNGSDARGPMGMAEVTLAFENDGQGVPAEYANFQEIQVTRRLFRDGDSEYEINKTPCRLKDVHDLFLGTGVGTRAYSIIQQGQVAEIMRVKPEERRRVIEEAAGITKYKARKDAAIRKMDATRQNLTRIDDVTREIGRRLGSLRRQAKKAEKYKELRTEVREIELYRASLRYLELKNAIAYDSAVFASVTSSVSGDVERVQTLEKDIETRREKLQTDERGLNERQGRLYEIDAGLALNQQSAEHAKREYERSKKRDEEAAIEMEQVREQRAMLEGALAALAKGQSELDDEASQDEGALQAAGADLDVHKARRHDEASRVEELRKGVIARSTDAAKAASDVHNLRVSLEDMEKRKEAVIAERAPLEEEVARFADAVRAQETDRQAIDADRTAADTERKETQDAIATKRKSLQQAQRNHTEARDALEKKKSRLHSLEEIHARYEQSPEAVRALLQRGGPLEGRGRLLVDLFEAGSDLELPIEAALGSRLQAVVVDDVDIAMSAADYLRDGKAKGRVEVLVEMAQPGPLVGVGFAGAVCALNGTKFSKKPSATVQALLSRLFVVENVAMARSLWEQARAAGATLVTRGGEVFFADGVVRGGSPDKADSGVLRQKREMRELADEVATKEADAAQLLTIVEAEQAELQDLDEKQMRAGERAQALSLKLVEVKGALKRSQEEHTRLDQRNKRLTEDEARLQTSLDKSQRELGEKTEALRVAESGRAEFEAELTARGQTLIELDQTIAAKQEVVTTMKVRAASIAERKESLKRNLEQSERQAQDLDGRVGRLQRQIEEGHAEREKLTQQEADARGQLAVLADERGTVKVALEEARAAWEQQSEQLRMLEHEARAARAALDAARGEHSALQLRIREREMELDALVDRTIERHRTTPQEILWEYHMRALPSEDAISEMDQRLLELEKNIESLGAINLTAIEECAELEKRHDFLRTQADDLTHALNQLEKAIIKINRTTKKRFQETFEGINERFQQVFPRLFRGGKAWLALTDPNDMLTTGVEIYAQPPGKKLGSVALMSGGEQALTAVSLVFAIFLLKPSPFCLLDEVDAPLDEANVGRFNDMVRDVSAISQFIVITHNKKTMEVADQLYGITMEEPGISKTVNVQIQ